MFEFNKNYFELFELPQTFAVDLDLLRQRYRQVLLKVHPDKFVHATDHERRLALQYSALVNEAWRVLSLPLQRAIYLLGLQGVEIDLESNTIMSTEFLTQQLEWREAIAQANGQSAVLMQLASKIEKLQQELIQKLTELFNSSTPETLQQAKAQTLRLSFFDRLLKDIQERL